MPESGVIEDLLGLGISVLDVAAVTSMKSSVFFASAKAASIVAPSVSNIINSLKITARTKEIWETFLDPARGIRTKLSRFEAQGGAILEESYKITKKNRVVTIHSGCKCQAVLLRLELGIGMGLMERRMTMKLKKKVTSKIMG